MEVAAIEQLYTQLISLIKQLQTCPSAEASNQEKKALHQLFFIFGNQMSRSLQLLDQKAISQFTCQQMQQTYPITRIYKVNEGARSVLVFISENGAKFCNCEEYSNNIISDSYSIICSHILSALLADAYTQVDTIEIDLAKFINISSSFS